MALALQFRLRWFIMAQADPRSATGRRFKLARTVMLDSWRGIMRVRKWPKPRGGPRTDKELYWQEWFREANLCAKYAPPEDQIAARQATAKTVWKPRDLLIKAMRGRMWSFITPEGRKIHSMAMYEDTSDSLDVIAQYPGSFLVRGSEYWEYLTPGPSGSVLTSQGEGQIPRWAVGGGNQAYKAPSIDDFSTWINQGAAVCEQAKEGPLVISSISPSQTVNNVLRVKHYTGPNKIFYAGLSLFTGHQTGHSGGIYLRDSSSRKLIRFHLRYDVSIYSFTFTVDYYPDEISSSTNIFRLNMSCSNRAFLFLKDDGQYLHFGASAENAGYTVFHSMSRDAYLSNIDQIGLGISNGGGKAFVSSSFFHYDEIPL